METKLKRAPKPETLDSINLIIIKKLLTKHFTDRWVNHPEDKRALKAAKATQKCNTWKACLKIIRAYYTADDDLTSMLYEQILAELAKP